MMNSHRPWLIVVIVAIVIVMNLVVAPRNYGQAQSTRLLIVTSTTIIADVVQQVAGEAADVVSLMDIGQDPHTFEPSGADVVLLDEADIVFVNGADFEESLLPVLEEAAGDKLREISTCVPVLPVEFALGHGHADDTEVVDESPPNETETGPMTTWCASHHTELDEWLGSVDTESTEYLGLLYQLDCHIGSVDAGHVESCDPHVWTDPRNVMLWTMVARDLLSENDPANEEIYAANAAAYLAQLSELDGELASMFESIPAEQRIIITNHGMLGYMAHRYGFEIVGTIIPGGGTAAEPSPDDVVALIETVVDYDVSAIFTEYTVSDTLAGQVADETGVYVLRLYTGSLTDAGGDAPTYIDYMRYNATTIVEGLGR